MSPESENMIKGQLISNLISKKFYGLRQIRILLFNQQTNNLKMKVKAMESLVRLKISLEKKNKITFHSNSNQKHLQ